MYSSTQIWLFVLDTLLGPSTCNILQALNPQAATGIKWSEALRTKQVTQDAQSLMLKEIFF